MQISKHIGVAFCVMLALLAFALVPASQAATTQSQVEQPLIAAVNVAVALAPASRAATTQSQVEQSLIAAVNDVRAAHNLRPLRVDAALLRAARSHSTTLLRQNVFTHGAFGARIAGFGARGPAFGENLAWGTGRHTAARTIVDAWLQSRGHRANLLRPGWSRIGIGARSGHFLGHAGATVVTADFAGS